MARRLLLSAAAIGGLLAWHGPAAATSADWILPGDRSTARDMPALPVRMVWHEAPPAPAERPVLLAQAGSSQSIPLPRPPAATAPASVPAAPRLNPTGRQIELLVPVTDGQAALGETSMILGADDSIRVGVEPLLRILTPLLDQRALERLRGQTAGRLDLTAEEWGALGYAMSYDPGRIELRLAIPAGDRLARRIELSSLDRESVGSFDEPARLSGYLNLRSGLDYVIEGGETGLTDPNLTLNGALRFGGVVLESEGNYSRGRDGDYRFQREGTRLVWDDTARTLRWSLGDVVSQGGSFASVGDVLGLSVFRTYQELAPQRFVRPRGGQEFTLQRASTVEAIVNGRSVRRLRLDPGTYQLSDFPFTEGSNDVRLVVEDDTGVRDTIDFNVFFDRTLLDTGLTEFSFTVGALSERGDSGPEYSSDEWVAAGFFRRGFSDRLTAGFSGQIQEGGALAGAEILWGAGFGTVAFGAALSDVDGIGTGTAFDLTINRLTPLADGGSQNFSVSVQSRSDQFATPGSTTLAAQSSLSGNLAYSRSFGQFSFGGFDVRYVRGDGTRPDQTSARATFGRRIGATGSLSIDVDWRDADVASGRQDYGVRLAYTMRLGRGSSVRAEYDTANERARLSWQRFGGQGVGAYNLNADVDYGADTVGANINVGYNANRADLGAAFSTAYDNTQSRVVDQRASLRFGSSIAFADGAFAIGRPVSDSFAIVTPHPSLGRSRVFVERTPEGFSASTGPLGGALYSELSAYSERAVTLDAPDAPAGYDLGAGSFRVNPSYRSGYRIEVGSDYSMTVTGRLLDRDGQPVSLLAGFATEMGVESGRRVTVFTNREGRFAMIGVRAGRWRIVMPTVPESVFEIEVQDTPNGILRAGDLEAR